MDPSTYFQNNKLSIPEGDRIGKFGTVKNSISSQIIPAGSINRAVTAL
jgi:hypothetical protein